MGNKVCCENGTARSLSPLDVRDRDAMRRSTKESRGAVQEDNKAASSVFITLDKLEICKGFCSYLTK